MSARTTSSTASAPTTIFTAIASEILDERRIKFLIAAVIDGDN